MKTKKGRSSDASKNSSSDEGTNEEAEGGGSGFQYCFEFPGGEDSPRKIPKEVAPKGAKETGDDRTEINREPSNDSDIGSYSDKYTERLLHWGGYDFDSEESGVENSRRVSGWRNEKDREEFNRYLSDLLEKDDYDKLQKQEAEIKRLRAEIERYKLGEKKGSKGKKGKRGKGEGSKEHREKGEKEKVKESKQDKREKEAPQNVTPSLSKKEAAELSEKEQALLEYKKAIAAKYARIRTDVQDHRSQMILGYYSDRLSKRLGNSAESNIAPGASRNENELGTSKGGAPEVPVLNLARAGSSIEPRGQSRSSDDLGGSPMSLRVRRSRMAASNKAFLSESQEGAEASPPHGQTPPYRWNRPGTTISISPRETPEGSRNFAISFQEKKEEEKRYCVVVGDRFCGKTSLLDAVCVPRAAREKYDKDLRKSMKGSWFKRGNSLKKGSKPKKEYSIRFEDSNGKMKTLVFFDFQENEPDFETKKKEAFQNADICLICFPVDDDSAFERLQEKWIPETQSVEPPIPIVLVGTRADMRLNGVERLTHDKSFGGTLKGKGGGNKEVDDKSGGDKEEEKFKALQLTEQMKLNGYVECSILFRKTLERFLCYVSSLIEEAEARYEQEL